MNRKIIIFWLVFIILIGFMLFSCFVSNDNAEDIIESRINIKIPPKSKILKFNYNRWNGNFDAKIIINTLDFEKINKELINCFGHEYDFKSSNYIPNRKYDVLWWDLDENKIDTCYFCFASGERKLFMQSPKTREIWIFIVKQEYEQNYCLYITYF